GARAGLAGGKRDPAEAGQLVPRAADAQGIHADIELDDRGAGDRPGVGQRGADARRAVGVDLRFAGRLGEIEVGVAAAVPERVQRRGRHVEVLLIGCPALAGAGLLVVVHGGLARVAGGGGGRVPAGLEGTVGPYGV